MNPARTRGAGGYSRLDAAHPEWTDWGLACSTTAPSSTVPNGILLERASERYFAFLGELRKGLIRTGPSERGIRPPQAAWRGAVECPSGGPSAPGRRCWRLGRKRPSPFTNSGPTPLCSDPNLGAMKFKVLLRKRGGARARACGRRARSCKHNDVGKLCIEYTVGSKHGTRARSILSAPCKRVARAGEGARVRVGGGARCRNAAPRSGAQCSVVARVSTQPRGQWADVSAMCPRVPGEPQAGAHRWQRRMAGGSRGGLGRI